MKLPWIRAVLPRVGSLTRTTPAYTPLANGLADPGEVVWGWVPYEEDASRGKDRPVLVVARDVFDSVVAAARVLRTI